MKRFLLFIFLLSAILMVYGQNTDSQIRQNQPLLSWNIGTPTVTNVTASFNNGTLTISGKGAMMDWIYNHTTLPWYSVKDEIKRIVINNGVTSIGNSAFLDCISLTSVTIPNSVTKIGEHAFQGCSSLSEIHINNLSPPSVGDWCFLEVKSKLFVPAGSEQVYKTANGWNHFYLPKLQLLSLSTNGTIFQHQFGSFTATLKNNGNVAYNSMLWIYLEKPDNKSHFRWIGGEEFSIAAGETKTITISGFIALPTGTYNCNIVYDENNDPSDMVTYKFGNFQEIPITVQSTSSTKTMSEYITFRASTRSTTVFVKDEIFQVEYKLELPYEVRNEEIESIWQNFKKTETGFVNNDILGIFFQKPNFGELEEMGSAGASTGSILLVINGKSIKSSSVTNDYHVHAQKVGSFIIPPATVSVDGKIYSSNALSITVIQEEQYTQYFPSLELLSIEVNGTLKENQIGLFTVTLRNNGNVDYNSHLCISLMKPNYWSQNQSIHSDLVSIASSETKTITISDTITLPPDTYNCSIMFSKYNTISDIGYGVNSNLNLLVTVEPYSYHSYLWEGNACFERGDYDSAKKNYEASRATGGSVIEQLQRTEECIKFLYAANLFFEEGNKIKACEQYEQILRVNPHDPLAKERIESCEEPAGGFHNFIEKTNNLNIEMIAVEGGTFTMGCTSEQGEDCWDQWEKPDHRVTVSNFYIGKYEVTQAQWKAIMGTTVGQQRDLAYPNWRLEGEGDNYPMYFISWNEVQEFIHRLNYITGKQYRLPTEAEWEFAARGGNRSRGFKFSGSNYIDNVAWHYNNSNQEVHPVGLKWPNELGICDMSGNVWEYCNDWFDSYSSEAQTNPQGPTSSSIGGRVTRGGSKGGSAKGRVSERSGSSPDGCNADLGFRLACSSK